MTLIRGVSLMVNLLHL